MLADPATEKETVSRMPCREPDDAWKGAHLVYLSPKPQALNRFFRDSIVPDLLTLNPERCTLNGLFRNRINEQNQQQNHQIHKKFNTWSEKVSA